MLEFRVATFNPVGLVSAGETQACSPITMKILGKESHPEEQGWYLVGGRIVSRLFCVPDYLGAPRSPLLPQCTC